MKEASKKIATLSTEEISLMTGPMKHYYEDRVTEGFTFDDQLQDDIPAILSDRTRVGKSTWAKLKQIAMDTTSIEEQSWFVS